MVPSLPPSMWRVIGVSRRVTLFRLTEPYWGCSLLLSLHAGRLLLSLPCSAIVPSLLALYCVILFCLTKPYCWRVPWFPHSLLIPNLRACSQRPATRQNFCLATLASPTLPSRRPFPVFPAFVSSCLVRRSNSCN